MTVTNEERLQELKARFVGLGADITLSRFDWRVLMESGALVSLRVSRYRGIRALTAADLGISAEDYDQVEKLVQLGHRLILPADVLNAFNSVETRARQVVRAAGLQTPAGLFVPSACYETLRATVAEYKARFDDLVTELLDRLPEHRETMAAAYYTLAAQVYDRLWRAGTLPSATRATEFTESFVTRCMATFPERDTLARSFEFRLMLSFVPTPYETQRDAPDFAAASDDIMTMRRDVLEQQRRAREETVNGFLASIQGELYGAVNQVLSDVLAGIQRNGNLGGRSVAQLRNLCEKLNDLNFWQDQRLDVIQAEITRLLDASSARRDTDLDRGVLETLQNEARVMLLTLDTSILGIDPNAAPSAPVRLAESAPTLTLQPQARRVGIAPAATNGRLF